MIFNDCIEMRQCDVVLSASQFEVVVTPRGKLVLFANVNKVIVMANVK